MLATLRLLVGRLPLVLNKEVLFGAIAVFLMGQEKALVGPDRARHRRDAAAAPRLRRAVLPLDAHAGRARRALGQSLVVKRKAAVLSCCCSRRPFRFPREERSAGRDADCRPGEPGPAVRVNVDGFKDRQGRAVLELYPANDEDFLAPDGVLIAAGNCSAG